MKEVFEILKKCNTYYLATMEGDQPRVRPFGEYSGSGYTASPVVGNRNSGKMETMVPVA